MIEHELDVSKLSPIDCWITPDVVLIRQLGLWTDVDKEYEFMPARPRGLVIITTHNAMMHCKPLQAFVIHRPAVLHLSWSTDKIVRFREISKMDALSWRMIADKPFIDIESQHGNTF